MYGSPFCTHTFTEGQLAGQELVTCECGNKYQPSELRSFTEIQAELTETQTRLGALVKSMAAFNISQIESTPTEQSLEVERPAVIKPEKAKPAKPKRERPKLSVTQWLIVTAGFMVLVAASVFVSQNLEKWNVYGWSTLELSLGLISGFGAFKLKRFSILLSNFLAVFSSAMLLTLIMSFSTTLGLGFTDWNREPSWFWALNLGTVALVSLGLGMRSKNFGWRAMAPLSLSASAITLVINSAGTFEDRWRIAVLSVALFAVLIVVRLSRNAKWEIENGKDKAYLTDLQAREDNSLKRFGVAVAILLAAFSAFDILRQLGFETTKPLDGIATLTAAAVWLVGARINRSWVSALVDKDETILTVRNTASAIGLSLLGLGVLSAIYPIDYSIGLTVAVTLLVLVFALEHFGKALLLPTFAVTISAWVTAAFGALWYLVPGNGDKLAPLGFYLIGIGVALAVREFFTFSSRRIFGVYATGFVGSLAAFTHFRLELDPNSVAFAFALAIALVVVNLFPLAVSSVEERAKVEALPIAKWFPLVQSVFLVVTTIPTLLGGDAKTYLLALGSGFLAVCLAAMLLLKHKQLADRFSEQAFVAIGFSIILSLPTNGLESLKIQSAFVLLDGLIIFGYALLSKKIRWAYLGYGVTVFSIVASSYAWGTAQTTATIASGAILLGGLVNLGLNWANSKFGKTDDLATWVPRITTGISLFVIITIAERFVPLNSSDYWILTLVPLAVALAIELSKSNNFAFIYAGASLLAASPTYTNQPELDFYLRLTLVLASVGFILIRRSRATKVPGWIVGTQIVAAIVGYLLARIGYLQFNFKWNGPEVYAFAVAILLAVSAWLSRSESVKLGSYLRLDVPVLTATIPSITYVVGYNSDTAQQNATRLLAAAGIVWAHNAWRTLQRKQFGWLISSYASGSILAVAAGWEIYVTTKLVWSGPEVYAFLIAGIFAVNAWLNRSLIVKFRTYLTLDIPVLVAAVPSIVFAISSTTTEESTTRLLLAASVVWLHNLLRAKQQKALGWIAASYVSGLLFAVAAAREIYQTTHIEWNGPEVYAIVIAVIFSVNAWLNRAVLGKLEPYLTLDLPVLLATVPSLLFGLVPNGESAAQNANRLLLATAIVWAHNVWRTHQRKQQIWLITQAVTGLIFAWSLVHNVYVNAQLVWEGPELYSFAVLGTVLVGLWLAGEQKLLQGSIYKFGFPVAIAITPSVIFSWSSVTKQFSELDATEITRTLFVLVVAIGALVFGILKGNRGLNLVGTVELWLIGVPSLWFKTSSIDHGSADLELRGLIIAAVIYWAIALLRQYAALKAKSIVFIGIPVTIALGPAVFHTLSTLGGSELRSLDWWRFSIVLTVSLALLIVGSLRELGGTFFPGLIGVIVTVLPYGFHPLTNKEWFLWAILLGVAGLLVWLAVRLENMRKAGREPSVWLKELK